MLLPRINTPREAVAHYDKVYQNIIDSGAAQPFLYPAAGLGGVVVIAYLLIDHRNSPGLRRCRFLVFAAVASFALYCCTSMRARSPSAAFGVGLISCFSALWIGALMVCNDPQTDFKRLERSATKDVGSQKRSDQPHNITGSPSLPYTNGELRRRRHLDYKIGGEHRAGPAQRRGPVMWQAFPEAPFLERLDWILDLLCSFRGIGWNWQVSGIPPPPDWVTQQLQGDTLAIESSRLVYSTKNGIRRYHNRQALLKVVLPRLIFAYFAIDVFKTLMAHDTYFWLPLKNGNDRHALPPATWLPAIIRESALLVRSMRLILSLLAIEACLWSIFGLGPLFFCYVLGPNRIGLRGEAWMSPDMFGNFRPVFEKGFAGWWGAYWHQTFRFTFEAPATKLLAVLGIEKRTNLGRIIALSIAFLLSGCLHASGSYTQLGETRPFAGPMRFFLLQGCAMLSQTWLSQQLTKAGVMRKLPLRLRQVANFALVHIWLYITGGLLADDFAAGGVWLLEPVPISILRGLGFGARDDSWWCWYGSIVRWHSGKHWWDTGIAL